MVTMTSPLHGAAATSILCISTVAFLPIALKPQHCHLRKDNEMSIPTMYCPYGNIIDFSRTSRIHSCYKIRHCNHWANGGKRPQNPPISLDARGPHLIHECLGDPTHHAKRQLDRFRYFRTAIRTKSALVTMRRPKFTPKNCPFPFDDNHRHLIHPSLDRPHSLSQTASGSNQPFCHNTLRTDRPTDRWSRRMFGNMSAPLAMLIQEESDALIITSPPPK